MHRRMHPDWTCVGADLETVVLVEQCGQRILQERRSVLRAVIGSIPNQASAMFKEKRRFCRRMGMICLVSSFANAYSTRWKQRTNPLKSFWRLTKELAVRKRSRFQRAPHSNLKGMVGQGGAHSRGYHHYNKDHRSSKSYGKLLIFSKNKGTLLQHSITISCTSSNKTEKNFHHQFHWQEGCSFSFLLGTSNKWWM